MALRPARQYRKMQPRHAKFYQTIRQAVTWTTGVIDATCRLFNSWCHCDTVAAVTPTQRTGKYRCCCRRCCTGHPFPCIRGCVRTQLRFLTHAMFRNLSLIFSLKLCESKNCTVSRISWAELVETSTVPPINQPPHTFSAASAIR